jgi:hypothetical protein
VDQDFPGSTVVRALIAHGARVRAPVRPTSPPDNLCGLDCELVVGDLTDKESPKGALKDVRYYWCPVYFGGACRKANADAASMSFGGVHDLNFGLPVCEAVGFAGPRTERQARRPTLPRSIAPVCACRFLLRCQMRKMPSKEVALRSVPA